METYRAIEHGSQQELIAGTMLLRRHRDPGLQVVMERWFEEVAAHSHRDQLSFNVVAREIGFSPSFLPGTLYANDLMKWPVVTRFTAFLVVSEMRSMSRCMKTFVGAE